MKTSPWLFVSVFVILLSYSCKKDRLSHSIVAGDTTGMAINTYDTLIIRGVYKEVFDFDVDNDQMNDFRLVSFNLSGASMAGSPQNGTSIVSLHGSATIMSYLETDTLFSKIRNDTMVNGSKIEIYRIKQESCRTLGLNESIKNIWDQNKVTARKINQEITSTEQFVSDSITITRVSYGMMPFEIYHNGDTVVYGQYVYYDQCNMIIKNDTLFFGIKIGERLGWIKLMIMDDYKILLMESAVEEDN